MAEMDTLSVEVTADTSAFQREMAACDKLARGFGASLTRAFTNAVTRGQSLGSVLQSLGQQLSSMALRQALQPLTAGISNTLGDFAKGFQGLGQGVSAEAGPLSGVTPFARGGVVAAPTYFPMGDGRAGLMGERGLEAVMPLARTADGRLGIAAQGNGRNGPAIVMNVTASDAGSFRRSEAELTAMLARAVARGRRGV
ncbi:phage tail tape measure protein [Phreatobacter aquaticus]|uniref:Phage tail tape measure protein n=1 Tax=Phreatobacter aquaticus TaxID=2570229 RepID=A0A4D7QMF2_9HYPH|nr:phage tail tape measure protein [Phreatobacter aquaticus]QCK86636.1 phage tail tape measure protein [Phreatobacter aquaticus]